MQYTYDRYREFLEEFLDRGYRFESFEPRPTSNTVILRHDIDWSPNKALTIAEIEADLGVSAAFFFLVTSPMYNPLNDRVREVVAEIERLGHRVGLHFDTHQYWDAEPDADALRRRVTFEQDVLTDIADRIEPTVAFHNPPDWVLGKSFDGFVNAYAERFLSDMAYVADSNQRWTDDGPWSGDPPECVQVLIHPVLWGSEPGSTLDRLEAAQQAVFNDIDAYMVEMNDQWPGQERRCG
jgi:hypothetical protein